MSDVLRTANIEEVGALFGSGPNCRHAYALAIFLGPRPAAMLKAHVFPPAGASGIGSLKHFSMNLDHATIRNAQAARGTK